VGKAPAAPAPKSGSTQQPDTGPQPKAPAKDGPAKTAPAKDDPAKTTPAKDGPAKTVPSKDDPAKTTPAKDGPAKTVPAKDGPAKTAPAKDGPAKSQPSARIEKTVPPEPAPVVKKERAVGKVKPPAEQSEAPALPKGQARKLEAAAGRHENTIEAPGQRALETAPKPGRVEKEREESPLQPSLLEPLSSATSEDKPPGKSQKLRTVASVTPSQAKGAKKSS
jgi:hypothetical protein